MDTSNPTSYWNGKKTYIRLLTVMLLARDDGLEPPHSESESDILPLDESRIEMLKIERMHFPATLEWRRNFTHKSETNLTFLTNSIGRLDLSRLDLSRFNIMAGVDGFEPSECRSQSPVPYRLAIPQYITRRILCLLNYPLFYSQNAAKSDLNR